MRKDCSSNTGKKSNQIEIAIFRSVSNRNRSFS